MSSTLATRLWSRVRVGAVDDCWEWTGPKLPKGYGFMTGRVDRPEYAHRVSWEIANGPIPNGLCVLHRCDNPPCCNPAHLWLGTKGDNIRDAVQKRRHFKSRQDTCPRGHAYAGDNLEIHIGANGKTFRTCKACRSAYWRCRRLPIADRAACVDSKLEELS